MTVKLQNKGEASKAALPLSFTVGILVNAAPLVPQGGFAEKLCGDEAYKKLYIFPKSNDNQLKPQQKQNEQSKTLRPVSFCFIDIFFQMKPYRPFNALQCPA